MYFINKTILVFTFWSVLVEPKFKLFKVVDESSDYHGQILPMKKKDHGVWEAQLVSGKSVVFYKDEILKLK